MGQIANEMLIKALFSLKNRLKKKRNQKKADNKKPVKLHKNTK